MRGRKAAEKDPKASKLYVQSVDKAMSVLTAFNGTKRQLSLSEISELTGLDLSASQRFTYTLWILGYLVKDEPNRRYELSPRLLDFTYHFLVSNDLVNRAAPYLQQLASETEEATNLTVLDGTDIVFILRMISRNALYPNFMVGTRLPFYCTAPGLVMLSTFQDEEIDVLIQQSDLVAFTPATVISPPLIKARISEIRGRGFATTAEEYFQSDISIAAPIVGADGRAIGAISTSIAKPRWDRCDQSRLIGLVRSTAEAISLRRKI